MSWRQPIPDLPAGGLGHPAALIHICKELDPQEPRPWHLSLKEPRKAGADMASERNLLEDTENEVSVSSVCSDRSACHLFSCSLADMKIGFAIEYKYLGHILYSFRIHICELLTCQATS